MTPLLLLLLTVILLLTTAILTRQRSLAWALGIGATAYLILLCATALQLSLKYPGRSFLTYLERTLPLRTLDTLVTLALPSLLILTLISLPVGLILIRRPLVTRVSTWAANVISAVAGLYILLWLFFEPLQSLQPNVHILLKLVPLISDLLRFTWLSWVLLIVLVFRFIIGDKREQSAADIPGSWGVWPALALLGLTLYAVGMLRPA